MKKVLVAMSGGVDSSVAAVVLARQGYEVSGATMLLSGNEEDARDAKLTCDRLGIRHFTLDLKDKFNELVKLPFSESYLNGETPNPCVTCNKYIKFGLFLDFALEHGFDLIATGHYVKRGEVNGVPVIQCADDIKKDQSYVLWQLSEFQIAHAVFPLSGMEKPEARRIAEEMDLVSAHKSDSQDICFVPDGNYAGFITESTGVKSIPGSFVDANSNILGKHSGIINYTVGQRKGLGIAFGEPRYVLSKNVSENTVVLGSNDDLFKKTVILREVNLSLAFDLEGKFGVKIRYAHAASPASLELCTDGCLKVEFDEPQRAPAPGQSAVIYRDGYLVGGGIIK